MKLKIKVFREAMNITRAELANKLNVPEQTIKEWEDGTKNPSIDEFVDIGEALACSLDALVDWDSVRQPNI